MKKYVTPELERSILSADDVMTASYGGENGDHYGFDIFDEAVEM